MRTQAHTEDSSESVRSQGPTYHPDFFFLSQIQEVFKTQILHTSPILDVKRAEKS